MTHQLMLKLSLLLLSVSISAHAIPIIMDLNAQVESSALVSGMSNTIAHSTIDSDIGVSAASGVVSHSYVVQNKSTAGYQNNTNIGPALEDVTGLKNPAQVQGSLPTAMTDPASNVYPDRRQCLHLNCRELNGIPTHRTRSVDSFTLIGYTVEPAHWL